MSHKPLNEGEYWFNSAKIRLQMILTFVLLLVFVTILGIRQSIESEQEVEETTDELKIKILELQKLVENHYTERLLNTETQLKIISQFITETFQLSGETELLFAKNVITGKSDSYFVDKNFLHLENTAMSKILDYYIQSNEFTIEIFYKFNDGYVQVYTSDKNPNLNFQFFPENSSFVQGISSFDKIYSHLTFDGNTKWLKSSIKFINKSEVEGIISISTPVIDIHYFNQLFAKQDSHENGKAFIVDKQGFAIIHPEIQGSNIASTHLFKIMSNHATDSVRKIEYIWPESKYGNELWALSIFSDDLQCFINIEVQDEKIESENMQSLLQKMALISFAIVCLTLFIHFLLKNIFARINRIKKAMILLASGEKVDSIKIKNNDEISEITHSFNILKDAISRTATFVQQLNEGDYSHDYKLLSENDSSGKALNELKNHLIETRSETLKRREENELQNTITSSIGKINDIIRSHSDSIENLSYLMILEILHFIGCELCGVFLTETSDNKTYLKLTASYAYDRKRFINKNIDFGEGLVGVCALEKEKIYITELPDDYIKLTSGLGATNPKNLLLVPMLFDNIVQGVIEIASLEVLKKYEIEFVEKVANVLASTVSFYKLSKLKEQTNKSENK